MRNRITLLTAVLLPLFVQPGTAPASPQEDLGKVADAGAKFEKVAGGFGAVDGVAYSRLAYLVFSDFSRDAIMKYTPALKFVSGKSIGETASAEPVATLRKPSGGARGLSFDRQGRLLACETAARRVTRTEKNDAVTVLAERYRGKRLNGPRDVVHAIDGSTYFTDPGSDPAARDAAPPGIYQVTRKGELRLVAPDLVRPGGVTLSADHLILYATDSVAGRILAFEILPDGALGPGKVIASLDSGGGKPGSRAGGKAGGVKTDADGRLYCAGPGGIGVFDRDGKRLGLLATPEPPTNLGWGDDYSALYVAAGSAVYRIQLKVSGTRTF
jgi:gluconolactonase